MKLVAALFAAALGSAAAASPLPETIARLLESRDELQEISFAAVIRETTGKRVLPVDAKAHAGLLRTLPAVLDATLAALNAPGHPMHRVGRINEASRPVEDELRAQLNAVPGWRCTIPWTAAGHEQRSGYPDLRLETDSGLVVYFDPKLHAKNSRASSLRTFYYEPRALTGKIREDALHLLVGIAHEPGVDGATRLSGWELVDLSRVRVRLKAEFQASNADLYRETSVISRSAR